ncbi:MAG: PA14 domain-containing protein [Sedimentisphaerales bacterium]
MYRQLICLVSLVLVLGLVCTNVAFAGKVWETRVSSGTDDAEQDVIGGGMDPSSSDLEIFDDGGLQVIGLRFVDIPIPKGAIVDNAFVEFTCDETKGGTQPVSVLFEGELNPNPPTFADATNNITNRPTTTAKVVWVPVNWTEIGQTDRSSDITSIIQEIIDQADWTMGNALVLILRDNPDNPSQGVRCAKCASEPASAPLLHIEFRGKFAVEPIPADGGLYEDTSAVLNWLPGLNAVSHDVYFGENFAHVEDGTGGTFQGNQVEVFFVVGIPGSPVPDALVPGTTYYWRIDEIEADGVTINKGDIWSFTVPSLKAYNHNLSDGACFIDPQTELSWTPGSGAKVHTVFFGDNFDDVNSADVGSSQAGSTYDPGPLESDKTYYWRVDEFDGVETHKGEVLSFTTIGARGTGLRGDYYTGENFDKLVLTRIDPQVDFPWRGSAPDPAVGASNFSVRWAGDVSAQFTETYTFYTITDDGIRVWVNGKLIIENWTNHGDTEDSGTIDLVAGQVYSIEIEYFQAGSGSIAQLGWESSRTAKQLIPTDLLWLPVKARNPKPPDGAVDVRQTTFLSWEPGEAAASHRIYFGTDEEALKNANMGSPEFIGLDELGAEGYNPGPLLWDTTYYWRIDEVDDANPDSPWIGNFWSFTTANFPIVDDFEGYNVGNNEIWWAWKDGLGYAAHDNEQAYPGNGTGSAVGDETTASYTEDFIVRGGLQSMPLSYDNNKQGYAMYSEVELTLSTTRDWTEEGVDTLTVWFRGKASNDAEPLYVAVSNSTGTSAIVVHDDPAAAQVEIWTQWVIPLQALADQGIVLTDVDRIAIGLGTRGNLTTPGGTGKIYFDDIRLDLPVEAAQE